MQKIIILMLSIFVLLFMGVNSNSSLRDSTDFQIRYKNLQNYATSRCLQHQLKNDSCAYKDGSAFEFIYQGYYGYGVYNYLDSMVIRYLDSNQYISWNEAPLKCYTCLMLRDSRYLDSLIKYADENSFKLDSIANSKWK